MANNYTAVTSQITALQTSTKTLSLYDKLKPAEVNRFAELIGGSIRFNLQDFTNGKGDKSIFAYFNLDIFEFYDLMDYVKWQQPFSAQKIHGKYPETEGVYAGKCKTFHFYVQFQPTMPDGSPSKNPYILTIENGYAVAAAGKIKGSFYEQRGSFQKTASASLRMSYSQLMNRILRPVDKYIDAYRMYCASSLIPNGRTKLEEQERSKDHRANTYTQPMDPGYPAYPEQQTAPAPAAQQNQPVIQKMRKEDTVPGQVHRLPCKILALPVAVNEGYLGKISLDGKEYPCTFDLWSDKYQGAYDSQAFIQLDLKNVDHSLHCVAIP